MSRVVLYGKEGCSLCEKAKVVLDRLSSEFDLEVEEVDITGDPALFDKYRNTIPVVVVDERHTFESKITEYYLRKVLEPRNSGRRWPWQKPVKLA